MPLPRLYSAPLLLAALCIAAFSLAAVRTPRTALQDAVDRAMSGKPGTAVVADVEGGRLLAAYRLDVASRRLAYPGSSIKPFTLMALLASGKIEAGAAMMCKRNVVIAGRKLDCSHPPTGQALDAATALAYSCNSYFTAAATRLSPAHLQENFVRDGFAAPTGLVADEISGRVAQATSSEQLQLQAIGEWGIQVTPLEMLHAYRRLALLRRDHDAKLAPVFDGLERSTEYGMGHAAQPATMKVAGKTGTASTEDGPWTHAWFAGYAPARDPAIVVIVFLEKGRGGRDAAAVARQIFTAVAAERASSTEEAKTGARP